MLHFPKPGDNAAYFDKYISLVPKTNDILDELYQQHLDTIDLITSLDDETLLSAYAPGKWTILELVVHLMDTERIFSYRALRFSRNDKTELPGFDENSFAAQSEANDRKVLSLVKEFSLVRSCTIELFRGLSETQLNRAGIADGNPMKTSAIPYILCGHEIHHRNVIESLYIVK